MRASLPESIVPMSGNTLGRLFCVTSFGESHGPAMGCVVDGCPPGLPLTEQDIQTRLDRRRPGTSRYTTQRREPDAVQILSGVYEGHTTGTPIALLIANTDQRSRDYADISQVYRPAHADFTYQHKYGRRDPRGGGRASARETVTRVAAGAIAEKYLQLHAGVQIRGFLSRMGAHTPGQHLWEAVNENPFFWPDPDTLPDLQATIDQLRRDGDSIGAQVTVVAQGMPAGLGEPVFDKLDADIAHALMSINAVRGVELGSGFGVVTERGSEHRDEITPQGFLSNSAGGTLGGISSGQDIVAHLALKPTSSIRLPGRTIDEHNNATEISTTGRHDPCVGIRATPIAEAMLALVLMDHLLRQRAQNPDRTPGSQS